MKVLVGSFQCESNSFASHKAGRESFHILYGDDVVNALAGCKLLKEEGIQIVPMVYAVSLPSGEVKKDDYLELLGEFIDIASKHKDADGVYLYFHGAMAVEEIGSGEEYFLSRLRRVLGFDIPISIACDFHSIITDKYAESINALSGYRTAPHTDYDETEYRAVSALLEIIKNKRKTKVAVFRVPVLLADAAQTSEEPYVTLLKMLNEADNEPNIVAASLFNGQAWIDSEFTGASIALSYDSDEKKVYGIGNAMAEYFKANKEKLHFKVPAMLPDDMMPVIKNMQKPVFISDSGDNTTAGADGRSTFLLKKMVGSDLEKILFATIYNKEIYDKYCKMPIGTKVSEKIPAPDKYSVDITVEGELIGEGKILGFVKEDAGRGILVHCNNFDIIFSNVRCSFTSADHFTAMGIDHKDYNYIVLKIGYLWPEVAAIAPSTVFCLTPGTSTNDFSALEYKNLKGEYFYVK